MLYSQESCKRPRRSGEAAQFPNFVEIYPWTSCKLFSLHIFSTSQGCIFRLTCSYPELTKDHVLTSAYVKTFTTVTRNAVNNSAWRKKDCSWLPLNKHALNISIWAQFSENQSMVLQEPEHGSLRIRAHLSWRTGKHLHVLHVLRTYSTCSHPGW